MDKGSFDDCKNKEDHKPPAEATEPFSQHNTTRKPLGLWEEAFFIPPPSRTWTPIQVDSWFVAKGSLPFVFDTSQHTVPLVQHRFYCLFRFMFQIAAPHSMRRPPSLVTQKASNLSLRSLPCRAGFWRRPSARSRRWEPNSACFVGPAAVSFNGKLRFFF